MTLLAFFVVTLATLAGLAAMIFIIAKRLGECPETGRAAQAGGITITTGFLAIGGGAVLLISTLPVLEPTPGMALFATGLACLILGLGFTQAVTTLRAVVVAARQAPAVNAVT